MVQRPLDEQLAFYRQRPPSALQGLEVRATELPDVTFDGHGGSVDAIFEVTCPCGSREFSVWAWREGDEPPTPPVSLECPACEAHYEVFDADQTEGDPVDLFWDGLGYTFPVLVRFEYPSDLLGDATWAGKESEGFSWITIAGRTPTGGLVVVFDYECA